MTPSVFPGTPSKASTNTVSDNLLHKRNPGWYCRRPASKGTPVKRDYNCSDSSGRGTTNYTPTTVTKNRTPGPSPSPYKKSSSQKTPTLSMRRNKHDRRNVCITPLVQAPRKRPIPLKKHATTQLTNWNPIGNHHDPRVRHHTRQ